MDAGTVDPIICDQLVTAADQLQGDLAFSHAALSADQHPDAVDHEQLPVYGDRTGQFLIEPGDDVDDRMVGLFLTAEDRKVLFDGAFAQDVRTFMSPGD